MSRYADREALADAVSRRLLDCLVELQRKQALAQLCLCGGSTALATYAKLAELVPGSEFDPSRLELWWSDERYVPTEDPTRHVGQALALLGGAFPLDPGRTHPMPPATGQADVVEAAVQYATELGQTRFDICLLSVGASGHVASIPVGPAIPHATPVTAVHNWPNGPQERMTITPEQINRSTHVWLLADGGHKAEAVAAALAGDPDLPAARVHGTRQTRWFISEEAAALLPRYHCEW